MTAPLPCPVQDRCGGCPWMDRDLEAQRQDKVAAVERALDHPVDTVHVSPRTLGYRARITLRSGSDGAWSYSAPRSHDPVAVDHCPIARPELSAALAALPPVAGARAVELRSDGEHVVLSFDGGQRAALDALEGPWVGVARGGKGLWGETRTTLDVAGLSLGFGPATFYQVNLEMNALLVERVGHAVRALAPEAVLELYSGAGNLGLPLAATGVRITSIESHPGAVADARRSAEGHGLTPTLLQGNADRVALGEHPFDVLLLDPPRAGAPGVLAELQPARPRGVVYVSCNPSTLARDLKPLRRKGYGLARLELFDMFPHSPHVEVLAVLHRP